MHEQPDVHARLMAKYPQVPEWWYGIIFRASLSLSLSLLIACYLISYPRPVIQ
jgi:hypothetical protein